MQKGKIIRTIMGELLEPLGFTLKAIPKDKVWEFSRTIKNCEEKDILQYILIQEGQWDKRVYLNLRTSAYGHSGWYRINCFVPECTSDHLTYQTEDDFNKAIEVFVNFIQDFGLDFFNIISIDMPREDLTKKDHINLFENHKELCDEFTERENIDISKIDFYQAVDIIEKIILKNNKNTFLEMVDLFLELAAFYGEVLNKKVPVSWELEKTESSEVCIIKVQFPKCIKKSSILGDIVYCWRSWRHGIIQKELLQILR